MGALGFAVIAAGCSSGNDPATWAEAEADGNLRPNFMQACIEAGADGDFADDQATAYCECAFVELVEYYGGGFDDEGGLVDDVGSAVGARDFEAFKAQEKELRSEPEDVPADIRAMFTGCAEAAS